MTLNLTHLFDVHFHINLVKTNSLNEKAYANISKDEERIFFDYTERSIDFVRKSVKTHVIIATLHITGQSSGIRPTKWSSNQIKQIHYGVKCVFTGFHLTHWATLTLAIRYGIQVFKLT